MEHNNNLISALVNKLAALAEAYEALLRNGGSCSVYRRGETYCLSYYDDIDVGDEHWELELSTEMDVIRAIDMLHSKVSDLLAKF